MNFLDGKRWVYWLDQTKPEFPGSKRFRVSIVVENEAGHRPTGGGTEDPLKAPWYWDKETCKLENEKRGFTELEVWNIIGSSMAVSRIK
jgi:hypothetical protein